MKPPMKADKRQCAALAGGARESPSAFIPTYLRSSALFASLYVSASRVHINGHVHSRGDKRRWRWHLSHPDSPVYLCDRPTAFPSPPCSPRSSPSGRSRPTLISPRCRAWRAPSPSASTTSSLRSPSSSSGWRRRSSSMVLSPIGSVDDPCCWSASPFMSSPASSACCRPRCPCLSRHASYRRSVPASGRYSAAPSCATFTAAKARRARLHERRHGAGAGHRPDPRRLPRRVVRLADQFPGAGDLRQRRPRHRLAYPARDQQGAGPARRPADPHPAGLSRLPQSPRLYRLCPLLRLRLQRDFRLHLRLVLRAAGGGRAGTDRLRPLLRRRGHRLHHRHGRRRPAITATSASTA